MCIADAGRPDQEHVAGLLDEPQRRQVVNEVAVERGAGVGVQWTRLTRNRPRSGRS